MKGKGKQGEGVRGAGRIGKDEDLELRETFNCYRSSLTEDDNDHYKEELSSCSTGRRHTSRRSSRGEDL